MNFNSNVSSGIVVLSVIFYTSVIGVFGHQGFYVKNSKTSMPRMGRSDAVMVDPASKMTSFCRYFLSLEDYPMSSPLRNFHYISPDLMTSKTHLPHQETILEEPWFGIQVETDWSPSSRSQLKEGI